MVCFGISPSLHLDGKNEPDVSSFNGRTITRARRPYTLGATVVPREPNRSALSTTHTTPLRHTHATASGSLAPLPTRPSRTAPRPYGSQKPLLLGWHSSPCPCLTDFSVDRHSSVCVLLLRRSTTCLLRLHHNQCPPLRAAVLSPVIDLPPAAAAAALLRRDQLPVHLA